MIPTQTQKTNSNNSCSQTKEKNGDGETTDVSNGSVPAQQNQTMENNWAEIARREGLPEICRSFDQMNLSEEVLRGIYSYGFERPSVIQQKGIVAVASGRDIIAQSQSGTGKTGTFAVGALQKLDPMERVCQVLMLVPTRELATQVHTVVNSLGQHIEGLRSHACMGGTSRRHDIEVLRGGVHIVVGTPGRVVDMASKGHLNLDHLRIFILDEADEMLSKGFAEQIYNMFQLFNDKVQVCLFSATIDNELFPTICKFMRDPIQILVKKEEVTLEGISQFYVALEQESWKFATLCDLYETLTINQSIIYCSTHRKADWLTYKMREEQHVVAMLHGNMSSDDRKNVMASFRSGEARVLISTDLVARGIDVQGVSLVINYDLPRIRDQYIHRIGRSGRFGRKGVAINFIVTNSDDLLKIKQLQEHYQTEINQLPADVADFM